VSEPRTAAGRALLDDWSLFGEDEAEYERNKADLCRDILAIEAEAAAPYRDALERLLAAANDADYAMREVSGDRTTDPCLDCGNLPSEDHDDDCGMAGLAVWRREARALLRREVGEQSGTGHAVTRSGVT